MSSQLMLLFTGDAKIDLRTLRFLLFIFMIPQISINAKWLLIGLVVQVSEGGDAFEISR